MAAFNACLNQADGYARIRRSHAAISSRDPRLAHTMDKRQAGLNLDRGKPCSQYSLLLQRRSAPVEAPAGVGDISKGWSSRPEIFIHYPLEFSSNPSKPDGGHLSRAVEDLTAIWSATIIEPAFRRLRNQYVQTTIPKWLRPAENHQLFHGESFMILDTSRENSRKQHGQGGDGTI